MEAREYVIYSAEYIRNNKVAVKIDTEEQFEYFRLFFPQAAFHHTSNGFFATYHRICGFTDKHGNRREHGHHYNEEGATTRNLYERNNFDIITFERFIKDNQHPSNYTSMKKNI